MATVAEFEELEIDQLVLDADDTDVDKGGQPSGVVRQSTENFKVEQLIAVLERISSGDVKLEAKFATTVLENTRGKKCFALLESFLLALVKAFDECSFLVKKYKSDSLRAIKLEKEFGVLRKDENSLLFQAWVALAGDSHRLHLEASCIVFQQVLQHFWSCVALSTGFIDVEYPAAQESAENSADDKAEREAIRRHAGWAIKRARENIHGAPVTASISIKKSKGDQTSTQVSKECLLSFFDIFGVDQRQSSGKFLFIVNDAVLNFFIVLHIEVERFFMSGIDKDTVVKCLEHLSVSEQVRTEWKKVVGESLSEQRAAASVIVLQRIVTMLLKSKQQIIREKELLKPQKQSKSLRQTLACKKSDKKD